MLTGVPAGTPDEEGDYPAGTVFGAVQQKLKTYMEQALRLKKQIEDAQTKIDKEQAKNQRNYARTQARELAEKLIALRDKNPELGWPDFLCEIATMEMEE